MTPPSLRSATVAPILIRMRRRWQLGLALWCAIALALRISGMHLHVGDDHDFAAGVHLANVGSDHDYHHLYDHVDGHLLDDHHHASVDVGLSGGAPGKYRLIGDAFTWLPLLAVLLLALSAHPLVQLPPWPPPPLRSLRLLLLPPLRGPPAHA